MACLSKGSSCFEVTGGQLETPFIPFKKIAIAEPWPVPVSSFSWSSQTIVCAMPPHVVIFGGGLSAIHAYKALAQADVRITLIDKRNFNLFQPLLHQV